MNRFCKLLLVCLPTIVTTIYIVVDTSAVVFRHGGDNTYYSISACIDGATVFIGMDKAYDSMPVASLKQARVISGNNMLLDQVPITWTLNQGSVDIIDANSDNAVNSHITLVHGGTKIIRWREGLELIPGLRIALDEVKITDPVNPEIVLSKNVPTPFEAIVNNCRTTDPLSDNLSRIFYNEDYTEGSTRPVITSTINIITRTSYFASGQTIVDVKVGMHLKAYAPKVFITSPSGRKIQLFQFPTNDTFGTRLKDGFLTRDLMPNFLFDNESQLNISDLPTPYVFASLRPNQSLHAFNGEDPHGLWTLHVENMTYTRTKELKGWALEIEVAEPGSPLGFQNGVMPTTAYFKSQDAEITNATLPIVTPSTCLVDGEIREIFGSGKDQNALLRWDVSTIPSDSQVFSATLQLNITESSSGPYSVYALRRAWDVATVKWTQALTGVTWEVTGARGEKDRNPEPVAILTNILTGTMEIPLNAVGVSAVQEWVAKPENNFGLIIDETTTADSLTFSCRATLTPAHRPRLNVYYALPKATATDHKVYLPLVQATQP